MAGRLGRVPRVHDRAQQLVSLDESPLLEGLIYAGTDDGLLQVTEDGGKNWRKVEDFPGVPKDLRVGRVRVSARRQHRLRRAQQLAARRLQAVPGEEHRSRPHVEEHRGDLPDRHDVWAVVQDHSTATCCSPDRVRRCSRAWTAAQRWLQLKGGIPTPGAGHAVQKRENDLVLATFGRGFYVLDDYSALREHEAAALTRTRLYRCGTPTSSARPAWRPPGYRRARPDGGNWTAPNPPFGAVFTYNVATPIPPAAKLVLTITDDAGRQIRRLDVDRSVGLRRATWNLRVDPTTSAPTAPAAGTAGPAPAPAGRGNAIPLAAPGRYRATLGTVVGDTVTALGDPQTFSSRASGSVTRGPRFASRDQGSGIRD